MRAGIVARLVGGLVILLLSVVFWRSADGHGSVISLIATMWATYLAIMVRYFWEMRRR